MKNLPKGCPDSEHAKHKGLCEGIRMVGKAFKLAWYEHEKRVEIAKKALSISQHLPDAYCLLAEHEANTVEEAEKRYQQAVDSGYFLARDVLEKKHDDLLLISRPLARALHGLALCQFKLGKLSKSFSTASDYCKYFGRGQKQTFAGFLLFGIAYFHCVERG